MPQRPPEPDPVEHAIRLTHPLAGVYAYRFRDPAFDAWMRRVLEVLMQPGLRARLRAERLTPARVAEIRRRETEETDGF